MLPNKSGSSPSVDCHGECCCDGGVGVLPLETLFVYAARGWLLVGVAWPELDLLNPTLPPPLPVDTWLAAELFRSSVRVADDGESISSSTDEGGNGRSRRVGVSSSLSRSGVAGERVDIGIGVRREEVCC